MKILRFSICVAVLLATFSVVASANHLNGQDVPGSLLVVRNGYEWAWVAPCDGDGIPNGTCNIGGVALVMHHGFVLASAADWLRDFADLADINAAFHAGGQKCASPYFNSGHDHCDSGDLAHGYIANSPFAQIPPLFPDSPALEDFALRRAGVPEPSSMALLGIGLAALVAKVRRSR